MQYALNRLTIKGFKSIRELENFELNNLNILIGGNGAGKSNFIDFFRLLRAMLELPLPEIPNSNLKSYIEQNGGCDDFLFNGPKITSCIEIETMFGLNGYRFKLSPTANESFIINDEARYYEHSNLSDKWWVLGTGNSSPLLLEDKDKQGASGYRSASYYVYQAISSWKIYHFHDTSIFAPVRRAESVDDNAYLRFNAENIAPYLLELKNNYNNVYSQIIETIRLVAPFFDDFIFKPNGNDKVKLLWKQKGSDYPFKPHHLSDGTLRFICLTTALLQPILPSTMIIDEPELGLHPYAIELLAELVEATSKKTQIIIATQSPAFIDYFQPEDIIVVNREAGTSTFSRLSKNELKNWLDDYSLGELWRKNIVNGGPINE